LWVILGESHCKNAPCEETGHLFSRALLGKTESGILVRSDPHVLGTSKGWESTI
jgi:hypothetical protein